MNQQRGPAEVEYDSVVLTVGRGPMAAPVGILHGDGGALVLTSVLSALMFSLLSATFVLGWVETIALLLAAGVRPMIGTVAKSSAS